MPLALLRWMKQEPRPGSPGIEAFGVEELDDEIGASLFDADGDGPGRGLKLLFAVGESHVAGRADDVGEELPA